MSRIVGLDVGARRIGVAVSDSTATLATPAGVVRIAALDASAVRTAAAEVARLAEEEEITEIVVGLPRRLDGSPNELTARVETFAKELAAHTGRPVVLQDERLSSVEAERRLALRTRSWRRRKALLDAAAAAVILQDYLDERRAGEPPPGPVDADLRTASGPGPGRSGA